MLLRINGIVHCNLLLPPISASSLCSMLSGDCVQLVRISWDGSLEKRRDTACAMWRFGNSILIYET